MPGYARLPDEPGDADADALPTPPAALPISKTPPTAGKPTRPPPSLAKLPSMMRTSVYLDALEQLKDEELLSDVATFAQRTAPGRASQRRSVFERDERGTEGGLRTRASPGRREGGKNERLRAASVFNASADGGESQHHASGKTPWLRAAAFCSSPVLVLDVAFLILLGSLVALLALALSVVVVGSRRSNPGPTRQ